MSSPTRLRPWRTTIPRHPRCPRALIQEVARPDEATRSGHCQLPSQTAGESLQTATGPSPACTTTLTGTGSHEEYDPAYHELMRTAITHGMHAAPWADDRLRARGASGRDRRASYSASFDDFHAVVPALRYNSSWLRSAADQSRVPTRS